MKYFDGIKHVKGESQFLDDLKLLEGTLFASVFYSEIAHGKILKLDFKKASELKGVVSILTAKDITGENQIGGIIPDEKLFADDLVEFIGQPIALIIAENK